MRKGYIYWERSLRTPTFQKTTIRILRKPKIIVLPQGKGFRENWEGCLLCPIWPKCGSSWLKGTRGNALKQSLHTCCGRSVVPNRGDLELPCLGENGRGFSWQKLGKENSFLNPSLSGPECWSLALTASVGVGRKRGDTFLAPEYTPLKISPKRLGNQRMPRCKYWKRSKASVVRSVLNIRLFSHVCAY